MGRGFRRVWTEVATPVKNETGTRAQQPVRLELWPYAAQTPLLEAALAVYARVWPERDREMAREGFTRYAGYDAFHGLVALVNGEPVGVGYGARSYPGIPWHDLVAPVLGAEHPALQDAWRLVELAVVAEWQGHGIGGRLHDELLAAQRCRRALVSTGVSNLRARRMYERRGWEYVLEELRPVGEPGVYVVMARDGRGEARDERGERRVVG